MSSLHLFSFGQHPTNLQSSNITTSTVDLSWDDSACAGSTWAQYREAGSTAWTPSIGPWTPILDGDTTITGLQPATSYEWRVKCAGVSGWSSIEGFTTLIGCNLNTIITTTNSSCDGSYDGNASISISNGISPYTYLWSNNDTSSSINNIPNGIYTVTTTDATGCLTTDTVIIDYDNNISLSQFITPFADTTNPNFPNTVQAHNIWVFDTLTLVNYGCNVNVRPEFIISHQDSAIQQGQIQIRWKSPFGFVTIPYNINNNGDAYGFWSTGSSDSTGIIANMGSTNEIVLKVRFKNQAPYGTYSAIWNTKEVDIAGNVIQTVTDNDTARLTLVNCSAFSAYTSNTNITCFGDNNGIMSIDSIINGSGNYSYNWINDTIPGNILSTNQTLTNVSPGDYSCTITDNNWSCTYTAHFTMLEPSELTVFESVTHVACHGDSTGISILNIIGGTNPYGEDWNGYNPNNLTSGFYTYVVTDSKGCSMSGSVDILEPPLLTLGITSTDITNCVTDNGTINLTPNGGAGIYSFNWSNGNTTQNLSNLSSGSYSVTISDTNNCTITDSAIINDYISTISTTLNTPNYNGYNITCFGGNNGSIISNTTNAVGSLSFIWSDGQNSDTAINLSAGTYSLTVIDSLGCSDSESLTLTEPPNELNSSYTQNNITCFGASDGSTTINIIGGNTGTNIGDTNYIMNWGGNISILYNPTSVFQISGLSVGIYSYSITDLSGCIVEDTITITQPSPLSASLTTNTICCNGSNSGWINTSMAGGNIPYSFQWSNGNTMQNLTGLTAGTYSVIVTDNNNCSTQETITIAENPILITTYNSTNVSCFGENDGSITTNTSGGDGVFSYLWSNGSTNQNLLNIPAGTYTCTISDSCGCSNIISATITEPTELTSSYIQNNVSCFGEDDGYALVHFFGGTTGSNPGDTNYILGWEGFTNILYHPMDSFETSVASPSGVPAGVYPYSATDLNGCTIHDTITITQPDSLYLTYSTTNHNGNGFEISCYGFFDGEINILPVGGTGPFDCYENGVLQLNLNSSNLSAGNYLMSIIDNNGCTADTLITLYQPSELTPSITPNDVSCFGLCDGEITSIISGGIYPYSYLWTNLQNSDTATNLCAGNYTLTITDNNNCVENISTTINQPNPIVVTIDSTRNVSSYSGNDGYIYITTSGNGSFNINWTSNNGFNDTTEDIINIPADIYLLEVIDSNSCTYIDTIEINEPSSLWLSLDTINAASCHNLCDGSISITANGGDSIYTYSWTGPNSFTSSNNQITGLCYGQYIVTIDDGLSNLTDTFNIYEPQEINVTLLLDSIICHNNTSQAEVNVWGGTQPFIYNWSNGDNNYFTTLSSGNHSIEILDLNGCSFTQSFSLSNPDSIFTQAIVTNTSCFGSSTGDVSINILNGGTSPYLFSNNNGINYQNSNTFINLPAGNYSFLISDANGCMSSTTAEIIEPPELTSSTTAINTSCYGLCDGNVTAIALGGTPPYSYSWSNGTNNLCAGFYNVTIIDNNGCINTNSAIVGQPNPLLINIWINGTNISATNSFTSYQWYYNNNPIIGATDSVLTPSGVGAYYVSVTDTNGCSSDSYIINYTISSVEDYSLNTKIYPNPTNKNITIESEYAIKSILLYNAIGNQLYSVNNNNNQQKEMTLDLSTFAKGIYFIKININNEIINERIILQ